MLHLTREKIAVFFLVVACLIAAAHPFHLSENRIAGERNLVLLTHMACIKDALSEKGTASYIYNSNGIFNMDKDLQTGYEYFVSQSALAPIVLHRQLGYDWVVANLKSEVDLQKTSENLGLTLVKDCGDGYGLFHRGGQ